MAKILLAEDDVSLARIFAKWLSQEGHEVTLVENGQEGLRNLLFSGEPDLLITDVMMPGSDGEELTVAFGMMESSPRILVVTACADQEKLKRIMAEKNVAALLAKPVMRQQLLDQVKSILELG
jgi:CheY-like chemotaxis protein